MIEGVSVRIYRPLQVIHSDEDTHPALIYFHSGAYLYGFSWLENSYLISFTGEILSFADTHNDVTATLARLTGFIVVSVE